MQEIDQQEMQEQKTLGEAVGQVRRYAVGSFVQQIGWQNGNPERIALHAFAVFLTAKAAGGELNIESLQDQREYKSQSNQAGLSADISFGSAWGVNGSFNADRAKSNRKQVGQQSGIFAEEGGYHVNANNVDLKGAVIASQNPNVSELTTNKLTFTDIQNESNSQTASMNLSGGYTHTNERFEEKGTGKQVSKNDERVKNNDPNIKAVAAQNSPSLMPGLPMVQRSHDSSTTKAVLTEGKITLNKDTNPTQTTAKALGIQTTLENANQQVAQVKDVQKQVQEQKAIAKAISDVNKAISIYTSNQSKEAELKAERLEQAKVQAESQGNQTAVRELEHQINEAKLEQAQWQTGGSKKRSFDTAAAVLTTVLAGKSPAEVAVAASSPTVNQFIHDKTKEDKAANLLAHAALSALEAKASGQNALAGAAAGVAGEATAMLLAEKIYNKPAEQLTTEERETLIAASTLAGGLAAGAMGGNLQNAIAGMETSKRAVENNYLSRLAQERRDILRNKVEKGTATQEEKQELVQLEQDDQTSDYLADKARVNPQNMTNLESQRHQNYVERFAIESLIGGENHEDVQRALNDILTGNYYKPYGSAYALDEQYRSSRPSNWNWGLKDNRSQEEKTYQKIANELARKNVVANSFDGKAAESTKQATELALSWYSGGLLANATKTLAASPRLGYVGNALKNGANFAEKYPLITEVGTASAINVGYQLSKDTPYNPYDTLKAAMSAGFTHNRTLSQQVSINVLLNTFASLNEKDQSQIGFNALGGLIGTVVAGKIGQTQTGNKSFDKLVLPVITATSGEITGDADNVIDTYKNILNTWGSKELLNNNMTEKGEANK